jgi:aldose sugar dehydrogenase
MTSQSRPARLVERLPARREVSASSDALELGGRKAVWVLLAGLLLMFAPSQIWLGEPIWQRGADAWARAVGLAAAYWWSVGLLRSAGRARSSAPLPALSTVAIPLAAFYLAVLIVSSSYSRGVLLVGTVLLGLLVATPRLFASRMRTASLVLFGAVSVVVALGLAAVPPEASASPVTPPDTLFTHYGQLTGTHLFVGGEQIPGGGLTSVGDDMLLVTGAGDFFRVRLGDGLDLERLSLTAPLNLDHFVAATDTAVNHDLFRVAGILAQRSGDSVRVLVSHHYWKVEESCFVLRLSEATVPAELGAVGSDDESGTAAGWRTLFETRPCLEIKDQGHPFAGQQSGGRIAALGDGALLLSVGDHQFDGVNAGSSLPQAADNDYGKTILLPREGPARIFTLGHRNPQGLVVTTGGEIWLAEHGPRGGDELNLLVEGANYGWPLRTLGTQYGGLPWPLNDSPAPGDGLAAPAFAWVPSIGVSNLIEIRTDAVPGWRGDLLVAALGERSLHRLHREDGRFVYSERIETQVRVRDLAEAADGRLVLWFDDHQLSVFSPVDQRR